MGDDQSVIKKFTHSTFCGSYVRIIQQGVVRPTDELKIIQQGENIRLDEMYRLMTTDKHNSELIHKAMKEEALSLEIKEKISQNKKK